MFEFRRTIVFYFVRHFSKHKMLKILRAWLPGPPLSTPMVQVKRGPQPGPPTVTVSEHAQQRSQLQKNLLIQFDSNISETDTHLRGQVQLSAERTSLNFPHSKLFTILYHVCCVPNQQLSRFAVDCNNNRHAF